MSVADIFETMEYGTAPEAAAEALAWLVDQGDRFGHFIDGAFTKAGDQDIDLSAGTLGVRSKRYSMLVEDGVVKSINVEENPGAVAVSGADTILEQL